MIRPLVAALSTSPGIFKSIDVATLRSCASLKAEVDIIIVVAVVVGCGRRRKVTPPSPFWSILLRLLLLLVLL
jgi:hypothetical protein